MSLPFVATALAFAGFPLIAAGAGAPWGGGPSYSDGSAIAFAAATAIVSVTVTVFAAVPIAMSMLRRGPLTFKQTLIGGVALGNAPFALVAAAILVVQMSVGAGSSVGSHWYGLSGALRTIILSTLMGAALSSVFWLVGVRGRDVARN